MALTTYAELITQISNWAARTDTEVTNLADDFLDMAEAEIYSRLRVAAMVTTTDYTLTTQTLALPAGFLEPISLRLVRNGFKRFDVQYQTPLNFDQFDVPGTPTNYTITNEIEFDCEPDAEYELAFKYYKKHTALSGSNTTNWLLANSPQTLLMGALCFLYKHIKDEDNSAAHYQQMIGLIDKLNAEDKRKRMGGNLKIKSAVA